MENNKRLNVILILLIIVLYVYAYRLVFPDDSTNEFNYSIVSGSAQIKSNYQFVDHSVDPFRSKKRVIKRKTKKIEPKPQVIVPPPQIYLPQFQVIGSTSRNKNIQLSILINGQKKYLSEGEKLNEMIFKKITSDSIKILYKDSLFTKGYRI